MTITLLGVRVLIIVLEAIELWLSMRVVALALLSLIMSIGFVVAIHRLQPPNALILNEGRWPDTSSVGASSSADRPAMDVPGLSEYADRAFGFSFWYPSQWSVANEQPSYAQKTSYPGGTVSSRIHIATPQGNGFILDEITVTGSSITLPADRGCALTYFVQSGTDTLMQRSSDCDTDAIPVQALFVEDVPYTMDRLRVRDGRLVE